MQFVSYNRDQYSNQVVAWTWWYRDYKNIKDCIKITCLWIIWGNKKCKQNFGVETYWKVVTWKSEKEMGGYC